VSTGYREFQKRKQRLVVESGMLRSAAALELRSLESRVSGALGCSAPGVLYFLLGLRKLFR
jgi:hypothetical protein